jgi:hypothetical protein
MSSAAANPKLEVLTPQNCQLIFIDQQPQMAFGVQSIDRQVLKNNVVALAKAAKVFKIPTTITTVETVGFSGYTYPELLDVFPEQKLLERTSMNSWDDKKVRAALKANGPNKLVVSGLTEVCTTPPLGAMLEGDTRFTWYRAPLRTRMSTHATHGPGRVVPDLQQVGCWTAALIGAKAYDAVMAIVREHSGAYGMGVDYAYTMVHKAAQRTSKIHEALAPVAA